MTDTGKRTDVEARRQHIVDAACVCVRRAGFHGASMAEIAHCSGLSVGQIYRYFENKEAIIAAIVARDMAEMRDRFAELQGPDGPQVDRIVEKCLNALEQQFDRGRAALTLEVLAEAARNPGLAAILEAADGEERQMRQDLLDQVAPADWDERERHARGEVLSLIFEGLVMRSINNPSIDREALAHILRPLFRALLVEPLEQRIA